MIVKSSEKIVTTESLAVPGSVLGDAKTPVPLEAVSTLTAEIPAIVKREASVSSIVASLTLIENVIFAWSIFPFSFVPSQSILLIVGPPVTTISFAAGLPLLFAESKIPLVATIVSELSSGINEVFVFKFTTKSVPQVSAPILARLEELFPLTLL